MCSRSWIQVTVLDMSYRGLSFASLVRYLSSFSRSWGGSKEMLMESGSGKGHEVWGIYEMGWSYLSRCEEWAGREGLGFLLLDGLGGAMREYNLGRDGFGIFWAGWLIRTGGEEWVF